VKSQYHTRLPALVMTKENSKSWRVSITQQRLSLHWREWWQVHFVSNAARIQKWMSLTHSRRSVLSFPLNNAIKDTSTSMAWHGWWLALWLLGRTSGFPSVACQVKTSVSTVIAAVVAVTSDEGFETNQEIKCVGKGCCYAMITEYSNSTFLTIVNHKQMYFQKC
jgi:hypothetical protein